MTVELWSTLSGIILPFVISLLKKFKGNMPSWLVYILVLILSIGTGFVSVWVSGESFSKENILIAIGLVVTASQTSYHTYYNELFNLDERIAGSKK